MAAPDKSIKFPIANYERLCFLKNIISSDNIEIGDYTYYDDMADVENFKRNVKYHFEFTGDRLIIGKFCMIASGASFIMNGANHLTQAVSSYPFAVFGGDWSDAMKDKAYPQKGDTIIGNDVWIGHNAVIMAGVAVGDGAIIAAHSIVVKDVEPYSIVGGNPARLIKHRFKPDQIKRLLAAQWWNWDVDRISKHVQDLTSGSLDFLEQAQ